MTWAGLRGPMVGTVVELVLPREVPVLPEGVPHAVRRFRERGCEQPRALVMVWDEASGKAEFYAPFVTSLAPVKESEAA